MDPKPYPALCAKRDQKDNDLTALFTPEPLQKTVVFVQLGVQSDGSRPRAADVPVEIHAGGNPCVVLA